VFNSSLNEKADLYPNPIKQEENYMKKNNPQWLENAVFYEIYPQSFQDSNADGIGDIKGIIDRLPYISNLGCNAIWLNPCFESPFFDAGYDISDYKKVAPRYGTNEDLKNLFNTAHKLGIHIILDLVPGHTSIYHPWFKESMSPEKNEFSDRYIWSDNAWEDVAGNANITGSIRGISDRDGTCAANFYTIQPALNYGFANPTKPWMQSVDDAGPMATREAMKDVMRFWLEMGCDGFRVDMAHSLVKGDTNHIETIKLWQDFRNFLDEEFPDAAMISEWGEPDKSLKGGFHMDFLLHFGPSHYNDLFRVEEPFFSRRGKGDASVFVKTYEENYKKTEGNGLICIPSGNHDMSRITQRLDENELKLAFVFLLTMPGAPFIYYGDEIGMRHLEGTKSVEGGFERTASRSPMQWDNTLNAGFSSTDSKNLYIPIDTDKNRPTAQKAMADKNSVYYVIKELIEIRKSHSALCSSGKIEFIYAKKDTYPLVYKRFNENESFIIAINPSAKDVKCEIDNINPKKIIYSHGKGAEFSGNTLTISGESAVIFSE
jgi:maltose alpha-D-glucosyltransferase/alpha-amylase